jgi:hypothetical protein
VLQDVLDAALLGDEARRVFNRGLTMLAYNEGRIAAFSEIADDRFRSFGSVACWIARSRARMMTPGSSTSSKRSPRRCTGGLLKRGVLSCHHRERGRVDRPPLMRTLKEQCVYLHHFEGLKQARAIIAAFIARYNTQWLIERLRHRTPA